MRLAHHLPSRFRVVVRLAQRRITSRYSLRCFREYVFGKRIAVVGPAASVHGSRQGQSIDQFDIVMRFNRAIPIAHDNYIDIGRRTDILCNCLEEDPINGGKSDPDLWRHHGVSWVLSPYPRELWLSAPNVERFERMNHGHVKFLCTNMRFYSKLEHILQTRPNSGLLGILYLLRFNIKEMYVTGMTFGRDGYHPGYKPGIDADMYARLANSDIHLQQPQENMLRLVYRDDPRLKVDNVLHKILTEKS